MTYNLYINVQNYHVQLLQHLFVVTADKFIARNQRY